MRKARKLFSVTLSLLLCLNSLPFSSLAEQTEASSLPETVQAASLCPAQEDSAEDIPESVLPETTPGDSEPESVLPETTPGDSEEELPANTAPSENPAFPAADSSEAEQPVVPASDAETVESAQPVPASLSARATRAIGTSAENPMPVPNDQLVIQNGTYYGISKTWFESINPDKGTMYFSVSIPSNVTSIASDGFRDSYGTDKKKYGAVTSNDNLGSYRIVALDFSQATSLTTINSQAAFGLTALTGVLDLSKTKLHTLYKSAFNGCSGLTGVILPATLQNIGNNSSGSVFLGCSGLQFVRTAGGNPEAAFELPDGLKTIGKSSFEGCTGLPADTTVILPASVTYVGSQAFYKSPSITMIVVKAQDASGYDGSAFKSENYGLGARLTVFQNADAKTSYVPTSSTSYKNSLTYEYTLNFATSSEQKLYGQPLKVCQQANGSWAVDENYRLPQATAIEVPTGYEGGWAYNGEIITPDSRLSPTGDTLTLTTEKVLQNPTIQYIVDGQVYQSQDSFPFLNLTNERQHTIGVQVTHPIQTATDADVNVKFEYEWTDVWQGGKQGPRMDEDGFGRYDLFSKPNVANTITINGAKDERNNQHDYSGEDYGDGYYLVEVYGYSAPKSGGQWTLFYKSASTIIGADPDRTDNTAYLFYVTTSDPAAMPQVTAQDVTVEYGCKNVSLTADVTQVEGQTYQYQWYEAAAAGQTENGTPIKGATGTTYAVPDGKQPGTYYYYFQATTTRTENGDTKTVSVPVTLTVKEAFVEIHPADITVYMGGKEGADTVVKPDGSITSSQSLPEPGFTVKLPQALSNATDLIFYEESTGKSWTLQPYDGKAGHEVYRLVPKTGQTPVRMKFTDSENHAVVSDEFEVGKAVNASFTMSLYTDGVGTVLAKDKNGSTAFPIKLTTGMLHVRGTTGKEEYAALNKAPGVGEYGVEVPADAVFTINDSQVEANKSGIALLADHIINSNGTDRTSLLEQRGNEELKNEPVPAGKQRVFDLRYLDLVDTLNGNAWVKSSKPVTVSLPYPEGTDKDTEFTLLHYENLHRDMTTADVAYDIQNCVVSKVSFTKTDTHLEFTTDSGFSPFALVWYADKPAEVPDTDSNKDSTAPATTQQPTAQPKAEQSVSPSSATAAQVIPQTSDASHPLLWFALLMVSGIALVGLIYRRRKTH